MTYDLGDFLGVAAQKAATKVIMVGWGHWIGCLYLLVALARPTPESGTEEAAMGCDSSANMRKQLTDQFPEICTEVSEVFVDVCRVCPTGQYVRSVPRKIICAAIWRRGLVGRLPGCLASILLRDLCLSCSCSVW